MRRRLILVLALVALPAGSVRAQLFLTEPARSGSRDAWSVDVGGQVARPIGDFHSNVSAAYGIGVAVRHHLRWFTPLGLRADATFLNYGNERKRVPLSSTINRVMVDMNTANNIAVFTGGPELKITRGPVRPSVFGFVGYSYLYTRSSVGSDDDGDAFASSTNFGDGGLATGWGGGLSIPLHVRSARIAIDAGARRTWNGTRSYLRRGDIQDQPDGTLVFNSRTTDVDFWQFHVGASFSIRNR
jgi:hypothetical protein